MKIREKKNIHRKIVFSVINRFYISTAIQTTARRGKPCMLQLTVTSVTTVVKLGPPPYLASLLYAESNEYHVRWRSSKVITGSVQNSFYEMAEQVNMPVLSKLMRIYSTSCSLRCQRGTAPISKLLEKQLVWPIVPLWRYRKCIQNLPLVLIQP